MTKIVLSLIIFVFVVHLGFSVENNPVANPNAVVVSGNARFTILTPQLIRMEWNEKGVFQDHASFIVVNRNLPVVSFGKNENNDTLTISTSGLTLKYKKRSGPFSKENLNVSYQVNGISKHWHPGLVDDKNLKGTTRTLDGADGGKLWDGTDIRLEDGLISQNGFALLDDSQSFLFDNSAWKWVEKRPETNQQDWYFFGHGHEYKKALQDYTLIAGKIPLLPKYALGYWWSRYWVYSDQELRDLVSDFRMYDIPIDVLIIDMDWHETFGGLANAGNPIMDETGNWLGWTGYTWNRALFPDPEKFLDWTNKSNLKTALNLHPASGIAPMEDAYEDFARSYNFDTTRRKYIPFKIAEKKWAETYFKVLLHPFEKQGVDFWWLDWQQFPESKEVKGLSNTWWLNYTFFTSMEQKSNIRPMIFHRWGGMGNHRYPIGFSGDHKISWSSLKYQTYFTPTAANVGYNYWSHDIGGHASGEFDRDAQLYVRWLQFGIFSPILRTHSAKISSIERRFWKYPEQFKTMKELIQFRYALAPYAYSATRKSYDSSLALCRPMYYDYPESDEAYRFKYQYMFGDDMLVAPVSDSVSAEDDLVDRKIWLPSGQWYEWHSGSVVNGGRVISRKFSVDETPVYVKAGSIIPMYQRVNHLQQQVSDWVLNIVPGTKGETVVYEDDGTTNEYTKGKYATTKIRQRITGNRKNVTIAPREGTYAEMYENRTYEIRLLRTFPPRSVAVNGSIYPYSEQPVTHHWSYDARTLTARICIPPSSATQEIGITVDFDTSMSARENLLDGKQLIFRRISKMVGDMKIEVARKNWWSSLPNLVLAAEQTPTRIQYHPEEIVPLLEAFGKSASEMMNLILKHPDARQEMEEKFVKYLQYE